MNWLPLNHIAQFDELLAINAQSGEILALFKHSTRCSISDMAKNRLERKWAEFQPFSVYYLDLIQYRDLSNYVAHKLSVEHESPQVILLKNGEVIFTATHQAISPEELATYA